MIFDNNNSNKKTDLVELIKAVQLRLQSLNSARGPCAMRCKYSGSKAQAASNNTHEQGHAANGVSEVRCNRRRLAGTGRQGRLEHS